MVPIRAHVHLRVRVRVRTCARARVNIDDLEVGGVRVHAHARAHVRVRMRVYDLEVGGEFKLNSNSLLRASRVRIFSWSCALTTLKLAAANAVAGVTLLQ